MTQKISTTWINESKKKTRAICGGKEDKPVTSQTKVHNTITSLQLPHSPQLGQIEGGRNFFLKEFLKKFQIWHLEKGGGGIVPPISQI